jgi:hypothetical protein
MVVLDRRRIAGGGCTALMVALEIFRSGIRGGTIAFVARLAVRRSPTMRYSPEAFGGSFTARSGSSRAAAVRAGERRRSGMTSLGTAAAETN